MIIIGILLLIIVILISLIYFIFRDKDFIPIMHDPRFGYHHPSENSIRKIVNKISD